MDSPSYSLDEKTPVNNYNQNEQLIFSPQSNEEEKIDESSIANLNVYQNYKRITKTTSTKSHFQETTNFTTTATKRKKIFKVTRDEPVFPKINTITSKAFLDCKIELRTIALSLMNSSYDPRNKGFNAVEIDIKEPRARIKVYKNGKIICTGTKNESDSRRACRKLAKKIKSLISFVKFKGFEIINIKTLADTKFRISLNKIKKLLSNNKSIFKVEDFKHRVKEENEENEEKTFPGLLVGKRGSNEKLIIFNSGKINITGVKTEEQANEMFREFMPYLIKSKMHF